MAHYAGYTEEEIQPVLQLMIDYLSGPVVHEAFFKKYASKKFLKGKERSQVYVASLTNFAPASIVLRRWAKEYVAQYGNVLQETSRSRSQR